MKTIQELEEIIAQHNLVIRRIPDVFIQRLSFKNFKEGDEIEFHEISEERFLQNSKYYYSVKDFNNSYVIKNGRFYMKFVIRKKTDEMSGKYIVTSCNNSSSTVQFNLPTCGIGSTIEEAIKDWLTIRDKTKQAIK